ncbi:MAG: CinA family protein [Ruminococcus sp.]|nr:CinA family protein [Ruminococcus sp.]
MNFAEDNKVVTESIDIITEGVVKYMLDNSVTMSTAESCTGGMVAEAVTSVSGASGMFYGGVCTYTEEVKMKLLGVSAKTLREYTVYSKEVAGEMSLGAAKMFGTDCAVGITGLAGPGGGTEQKPVGTVYISARYKDKEICRELRLYEEYEKLDRELIRRLATLKALQMICEVCGIPVKSRRS